jgi:hypothetical protein
MTENKTDPAMPTPKMKRLYHDCVDYFGEEPEDLWVFSPYTAVEGRSVDSRRPTLKHVMVWPSNDDIEICAFQTIGMSEHPIPGTDTFAELHMAIRARLDEDQRERVARFLANLAEYPYDHCRQIDWWHLLSNPGPIPEFSGCPHLIFHPKFAEEGRDTIEDKDGTVKLLYVVPITPAERHLLVCHGRDAFIDHLIETGADLFCDRMDPTVS